jgi:hypothetical protein
MCISTLTTGVATGVLIAGLVISFHVGHFVWFAVDCF